MRLPNFLRRKNRRSTKELMDLIDLHHSIIEETNKTLDVAIAALDGETGWFDCSCKPKNNKECDINHVRNTARSSYH
jgi:hypothetical protein